MKKVKKLFCAPSTAPFFFDGDREGKGNAQGKKAEAKGKDLSEGGEKEEEGGIPQGEQADRGFACGKEKTGEKKVGREELLAV